MYIINKVKKLIDLNEQLVNFDLTFSVSCKEGVPFEALVVDQNTLDSNPNLEYKKASNGTISGHLVSDKNTYQNFFLILQSDKECEVEVTIQRKEIAPQQQPQPESYRNTENSGSNFKPNKINLKLILITVVIIVGVLFLWYYFNKNLKNKSKMLLHSQNTIPTLQDSMLDTSKTLENAVSTPNPSPMHPTSINFPSTANANLIARLNNLS